MNNNLKIAVVTGGNRGLGLEASRQLAQKGYHVILTSRDVHKGQAAAHTLANEGLNVTFHQLDVTDENSCHKLAEFINNLFGKLDVLINNAGILIDPRTIDSSILSTKIDTIQKTIETNLYGALRVTQALIPLMQKQNYGRIVNVSSGMGQLTDMGGGYAGYRISKTGLNAVTRMLASELKDTNILINSVCPGWVKTDMGGSEAKLTLEHGVDTIVWLATLPDGSPSGGFYRDRQPIDW